MRQIFLTLLLGCSVETTTKQFNYNPEIVIVDPPQGAVVEEGQLALFTAEVGDINHPDAALQVSWYRDDLLVCDWEVPNDKGESFCRIAFYPGDSLVSATVRDPQSAGGADFISVAVTPRSTPTSEIISPPEGAYFYQNDPIEFTGRVSDPEDQPADLSARWLSSRSGQLNISALPDENGNFSDTGSLATGSHFIELEVTDSDNKTSSVGVLIEVGPDNLPPNCNILSPLSGSAGVVGFPTLFQGNVSDTTSVPTDLTIEWKSDVDGSLGQGTISTDGTVNLRVEGLSPGAHQITLHVIDDRELTCQDTITYSLGNVPTLSIQQPVDGDIFSPGELVVFEGLINDSEDPLDTLVVEWKSTIDGVLSSSSADSNGFTTFSRDTLQQGWHQIELRIQDSDNFTAQTEISVLINSPPQSFDLEISPNSPTTNSPLQAMVSNLVDSDGDSVSVSYEWYQNNILTNHMGAQIPANVTDKHDVWRVDARAFDGYSYGSVHSAQVVIANTPPVVSSLTIFPSGSIYNNTLMNCVGVAHDPDESASLSFLWTNETTGQVLANGASVVLNANTASPLDLVRCQLTATDSDGEQDTSVGSIVIANRAPSISSIAVQQSILPTDGVAVCEAAAVDPDGQALHTEYRWIHQTTSQVIGFSETLHLSPTLVQPGDIISCQSTVSDPSQATASAQTAVTITNSNPTISSVVISPEAGTTNEGILTCFAVYEDIDQQSLTVQYEWNNDTTGSPLGTASSIVLDPSLAQKDDIISCKATVSDVLGATVSANQTIAIVNTPPQIDDPVISPATIYTDTLVSCSSNYVDLDGETLSISYSWTNLSTGSLLGQGGSLQLDNLIVSPNDILICEAEVTDSSGVVASTSATQVVLNTAPQILTVEITPVIGTVSSPYEVQSNHFDDDGDIISVEYTWYLDNLEYASGISSLGPGITKSSKLQVRATVTDQWGDSNAMLSNVVYVRNTPPEEPEIYIDPHEPIEIDDDLICYVDTPAEDADGDTLQYLFNWYRNGQLWSGATTSTTYLGDTIEGVNTVGEEQWMCDATASDGTTSGGTVFSDIVEVQIKCDHTLGPNLIVGDLEFNCLEGEAFYMGSPTGEVGRDVDEFLHAVGLTRDFFISRTEVTQELYTTVMGYNPSTWSTCGGDCPVDSVSWHDAALFTNALSVSEGFEECYSCVNGVCEPALNPYDCKGFRLPTEAEWEFAVRSGTQDAFWTPNGGGNIQVGDALSCNNSLQFTDGTSMLDLMWFCPNRPTGASDRVSPVSGKMSNGFGLDDMHGNIMEWTNDWYEINLGSDPVIDPTGPDTGSRKVVRGGYWLSIPQELRSAERDGLSFHLGYANVGFRIVKVF